jgi:hypothetical protein
MSLWINGGGYWGGAEGGHDFPHPTINIFFIGRVLIKYIINDFK